VLGGPSCESGVQQRRAQGRASLEQRHVEEVEHHQDQNNEHDEPRAEGEEEEKDWNQGADLE